MLTRALLRAVIEEHLEGRLSLEDLAARAVDWSHQSDLDPADEEVLTGVLSVLRDAADPHRFRWEEPDFEELLARLAD